MTNQAKSVVRLIACFGLLLAATQATADTATCGAGRCEAAQASASGWRKAALIHGSMGAADIISTLSIPNRREVNPIMGQSKGRWMALAAAQTALATYAESKMPPEKRWHARALHGALRLTAIIITQTHRR